MNCLSVDNECVDILQKETIHEDDVALYHGAALLELLLQLRLAYDATRGAQLPHHLALRAVRSRAGIRPT